MRLRDAYPGEYDGSTVFYQIDSSGACMPARLFPTMLRRATASRTATARTSAVLIPTHEIRCAALMPDYVWTEKSRHYPLLDHYMSPTTWRDSARLSSVRSRWISRTSCWRVWRTLRPTNSRLPSWLSSQIGPFEILDGNR